MVSGSRENLKTSKDTEELKMPKEAGESRGVLPLGRGNRDELRFKKGCGAFAAHRINQATLDVKIHTDAK